MVSSKQLLAVFGFGLVFGASACFAPAANPRPVASTALTALPDGRFTMAVQLEDQGPYTFLVDTGASHSVLTKALQDRLHFSTNGHMSAKVVGASGTQAGVVVFPKHYQSDVFDRRNELMVVLPSDEGVKAEGVVGMNAFESRRLEMNFAERRLTAGPSGPVPEGFVAQKGQMRSGLKLVVQVVLDGVPVRAMIDTGARRTSGNRLLQQALGIAPGDPRLSPADSVGGATVHRIAAEKATLGRLTIGSVEFPAPVVTFADLPVTKTLGLDREPSLTLGMDVLGRMTALAVDFPRAELQLKP
jgi:predicted aspartyl protease